MYVIWSIPDKILFLCLAAVCSFSCQKNPAITPAPPNIVWIVAEDISPALGCYGDSLAHTPNIDALARRGLRFDQAFATAPICAPSRSCLISGLYATALGTQHLRCDVPFPDELQTLPEIMREAGYFTSNRNKTDYNFDPEGIWEHWSGSYAPWRHCNDDRPFFSFINVGPSHEGSANRQEQYERSVSELAPGQRTNPDQITPPPYYPDSPLSREVWARYYDLLHIMDANIGKILDSLEQDGLMDQTIIFFFGDHGFGMPRYKRWLYRTGLRVPLVISAPAEYQHLVSEYEKKNTGRLVSFVDFAPTVLSLADIDIPATMQGRAFAGAQATAPRKLVYGARDRADDMYEMSRAVTDGHYLYVHHFMPHLPYMQDGYIYSNVKDGFRALREAYEAGQLTEAQARMWQAKPIEELYDLQKDSMELHNLAGEHAMEAIKARLQDSLYRWILHHRDLGLLPEAEYMDRSQASSPYAWARSGQFPFTEVLNAARQTEASNLDTLALLLAHRENGVRWWGVIGLMNSKGDRQTRIALLRQALQDKAPSVQIQAAEALCRIGTPTTDVIEVLQQWVQDDRPWLALQAARTILLVGEDARPLIPVMYAVLEKNRGAPDAPRKYKDFNFAAFTSWSLEWALQALGEDVEVN